MPEPPSRSTSRTSIQPSTAMKRKLPWSSSRSSMDAGPTRSIASSSANDPSCPSARQHLISSYPGGWTGRQVGDAVRSPWARAATIIRSS